MQLQLFTLFVCVGLRQTGALGLALRLKCFSEDVFCLRGVFVITCGLFQLHRFLKGALLSGKFLSREFRPGE